MRFALVVVGVSTGGLSALAHLLSQLPETYALPIVVVQHRSQEPGDLGSRHLQRRTPLKVVEASHGDELEPGHVYLAPSGYHLLIDGSRLELSTEAPVAYARPSIDVLFESAAESHRERTLAVVLTGLGRDGARGAARVKALGGAVAVQDPDSAEAAAMPVAAIAACRPDAVLPLDDLAGFLIGAAAHAPRAAGAPAAITRATWPKRPGTGRLSR